MTFVCIQLRKFISKPLDNNALIILQPSNYMIKIIITCVYGFLEMVHKGQCWYYEAVKRRFHITFGIFLGASWFMDLKTILTASFNNIVDCLPTLLPDDGR